MQGNGDPNVPITMENILNALSILHRGDQRVSEADRFLAQARASPQVWHVLPALLNSPLQPQLLFAAQALYTRIRADWLVMDNNARSTAVSLATEALLNPTLARQSQATRSSGVYYFGKALGCAVSRSPMDFQEPVWEMLILKLRNKPALKCGTMAAVATEMDQNATSHVANHVQIRAFCRSKAHQVVPDAVFMLASCRRNGALSEEQMQQLKAAIQCLQAWTPYADKMQIANALLEVITIPKLAQSATEALHEIVGYSGTSLSLLLTTTKGLTAAFHGASGPDAHVIHHAISEVVCSLSEWNADELMEQQTEQSGEVIRNVIDLLWTCLNAPDKPSFFAAIEGWMAWVAADHLMQKDQARLGSERVCAVLSVVIKRMESLSFIHNHFSPDLEDFETEDEKSSVLELLATGALSVGHQKYLDLVFQFLSDDNTPPSQICAALEALGASKDSVEDARIDEREWDSLHQVLDSVLRLAEVSSDDGFSDTSGGSLHWRTVVQNSALSALASHGLLVRKDEKLFYRTAVCAVNALQRRDLADRGAALLQSMSEIQAHSLLPFLRDLITALNRSVSSLSTSAAEDATDAVASVASLLRLRQERVNALEEMVRKPCERLCVAAAGRAEASLNESVLCRDLTLLSTAMRVYNDHEAVAFVFQRIKEPVFLLARRHCGNGIISKAICNLLEINAMPTLFDEEDEASGDRVFDRDEKSRLELIVAITKLLGDCFKDSGPDGECVWLKTMNKLIPDLVTGVEDVFGSCHGEALDCVTECVRCGVLGLNTFSGGNYDTQPEMTRMLLKLLTTLTSRASRTLLPVAPEISRAALSTLHCGNVVIVKASLNFWKALFSRTAGAPLQQTILSVASGPNGVSAGALCAARNSRCASDVADVLFAMCRIISGELDENTVLRDCLKSAFGVDSVPREGLDRNVREMLFQGCYTSVGNKKEFRQALNEFGKVCSMVTR
ncbi:Armadillo-like helical domain containing protein [Gracilaria domingensis]|nr:Armadillo-like helical domain containing protein [Gracilaria domingensis]